MKRYDVAVRLLRVFSAVLEAGAGGTTSDEIVRALVLMTCREWTLRTVQRDLHVLHRRLGWIVVTRSSERGLVYVAHASVKAGARGLLDATLGVAR